MEGVLKPHQIVDDSTWGVWGPPGCQQAKCPPTLFFNTSFVTSSLYLSLLFLRYVISPEHRSRFEQVSGSWLLMQVHLIKYVVIKVGRNRVCAPCKTVCMDIFPASKNTVCIVCIQTHVRFRPAQLIIKGNFYNTSVGQTRLCPAPTSSLYVPNMQAGLCPASIPLFITSNMC